MCICSVNVRVCVCVCVLGGGGKEGYLPFPMHSLHCYFLPCSKPTGAIYCDRALRINGFTGGVQRGTVLVVKAHSATPRWITTKKIDFDSKVIRLCIIIVARCSQLVLEHLYQVTSFCKHFRIIGHISLSCIEGEK